MDIDILYSLRESNERLIKLENTLDLERDALINHKANDIETLTDNAMYFNYMQMIERYTGFTDQLEGELKIFKDLLKQSVDQQSSMITNSNNNTNEITSNYLSDSNGNISYHNDSNASTNSVTVNEREIASPNFNSLQLPKIQPKIQPEIKQEIEAEAEVEAIIQEPMRINRRKTKPIRIKVANKLAYKYGGLGFDIWKKNGRRPIYTMTKLYVNKAFSCDQTGKLKLKKFLIKNGFKVNTIDKVEIIKEKDSGNIYGLIQIRDSVENIQNKINKINEKEEEDIIEYVLKKSYSSRREQNKKLFVKNFDLMHQKDHKKLTDMFLRFGDLDCDIFVNRDKNGNPYCFVTYRDINDAIACEKNQNWRSQWNTNRNPLWFNGRELEIQYVDDSKKNGQKKKSKRGKKYYNTRK